MNVTFWGRFEFARDNVVAALGAIPGAKLTVVLTLDELLAVLEDTEFLVLVDAPVEEARRVVERLRAPDNRVRWMHFNSAGRDGFEAAGIPPAIVVSQAEGALAPIVAEHVFALALALRRQLPAALVAQANGEWASGLGRSMRGLMGGTLLVVGAGHIGRAVAKLGEAFGLRVVMASRTAHNSDTSPVHPLSALPDLAAEADMIVLCVALGAQTRQIVDGTLLDRVRSDAILVNVGRGGLVDSLALAEALNSGRLAGAGLDVTDPEPLPADHPLRGAPNVIITAHVAGAGPQGQGRIAAAAVEQVRSALATSLLK